MILQRFFDYFLFVCYVTRLFVVFHLLEKNDRNSSFETEQTKILRFLSFGPRVTSNDMIEPKAQYETKTKINLVCFTSDPIMRTNDMIIPIY